MLEPLTALAVSCNIIELVVVAGKTCKFIHQIRENKAFPTHEELTSAISLLDKNVGSLDAVLKDPQNGRSFTSSDDKELLLLAQSCRRLAQDLKRKLDALQVKASDTRSDRLGKLFQTILQKGKIYDLQRRWDELRKAVDTALLVRLTHFSQNSQIEVKHKLEQLTESIAQAKRQLTDSTNDLRGVDSKLQQHITTELEANHEKLTKVLESNGAESKANGEATRQQLAKEMNHNRRLLVHEGRSTRIAMAKRSTSIEQRVKHEHNKTRSAVKEQLEASRRQELEAAQYAQLLTSLKFPEMNARRNKILDPHCHTFEWIFDETIETPWDSFSYWLENSSSIYWVNGKAGSGKSSLMRFICEHDVCQKMLDKWSFPSKTLRLSWYFWNSGTEIQRSLHGALSSLLHQLLSQQRSLALNLLRAHHHILSGKETISDWSLLELLKFFEAAIKSSELHIAIFLDGLDEFNQDEDVSDLLRLIQGVSARQHVKACVASRPEKYLESRLCSYPQLKLQDLTANDIKDFVRDRLRSAAPSWEENEIQTLALKVRERAAGVFLWVRLVTETLIRGLLNGDNHDTLAERLSKLPRRMESLYEHMWRSLNGDEDLESYRREAAQCFAFQGWLPMTLIELAVALDDRLQQNQIGEDYARPDIIYLIERCYQTRNLLQTRCAGLLEVSTPFRAETYEVNSTISEISEARMPHDTSVHMPVVSSLSKGKLISWDDNSSDLAVILDCLVDMGSLEINFIHRTARDFLSETAKGQEILRYCTWSRQDLASRVVNAYLQRKILDLRSSPRMKGTKGGQYMDLDRIVSLIFSLGGLPSLKTASWQYALLKRIDAIHQTMITPTTNISLSSWHENWYFHSDRKGNVIDFWGSTAPYHTESMAELVLSDSTAVRHPNSTHLLACACWAPDFDVICQASLNAICAFLDHGADPNSTNIYTHRSHGQVSPWVRFLRLARRTNDYSGFEEELVVTIEKFLASGAKMSATVANVWHFVDGELDSFDALMTMDQHHLGEVAFEVNATYFLRKICSNVRDVGLASKLEQRIALEAVKPHFELIMMRGHNGRWYRVNSGDGEEFFKSILTLDKPVYDYNDLSRYTKDATSTGVIVDPRSFLAARGLLGTLDLYIGNETDTQCGHLMRASKALQAERTIHWLNSSCSKMGITSKLANGFSDVGVLGADTPQPFALLNDLYNHLQSFYQLYGPLHLSGADTDEVYETLDEVWKELSSIWAEEASTLAGQELQTFKTERDELYQMFCKHGLETGGNENNHHESGKGSECLD